MPVHLAINLAALDVASLAPAIEALQRGEVIAYPTDTLYGLGADPRQTRAVDRLFRIKGRAAQHGVPLIAGSVEQALKVGRFNARASRLAAAFWPGPLTIVVTGSIDLAEGVGQAGTVAVRVPDHAVARALAIGLGFPITSTSANRTGAPPATTAREVTDEIGDRVSVIVDSGAARGGSPSTIVDLVAGTPRLVRAGAVPWERVLESLE
jgi:tRNA threonylcarbamoyl adenosine modification protein (Sua5/YciO/YrdC/YwlC family)